MKRATIIIDPETYNDLAMFPFDDDVLTILHAEHEFLTNTFVCDIVSDRLPDLGFNGIRTLVIEIIDGKNHVTFL